jgi:hypothetical protein
MSGDSQRSFSDERVRKIYSKRCVICLLWTGVSQCVNIIEPGLGGQLQVRNGEALVTVPFSNLP